MMLFTTAMLFRIGDVQPDYKCAAKVLNHTGLGGGNGIVKMSGTVGISLSRWCGSYSTELIDLIEILSHLYRHGRHVAHFVVQDLGAHHGLGLPTRPLQISHLLHCTRAKFVWGLALSLHGKTNHPPSKFQG